jgi:uncharacterized membrane protein
MVDAMDLLHAWRSPTSATLRHRPEVTDTIRGILRPSAHALTAAVGGAVLGLIILQVDEAANLTLPVPAANARAVVAGLVTALVTIALFSIWMRSIVAGLASGQVSSRIVAEHLDDELQWELITGMSAAFTFTLTVLLHLPEGDAPGVPAVAMILAISTVVLGLVLVMGALRSAVQGLSPSRLLASLAGRARKAMANDPAPDGSWQVDPWHGEPVPAAATAVDSDRTGWVRAIDHAAMLGVLPAHGRLGLHVDVGSFVTDGDRLASCGGSLTDQDIDTVRRAIQLTDLRNPEDDLGFVLQQLRDLAQHALGSEGDSSVSEEGLLHLRAILSELIETGVPSGHAVGDGDRAVIALERRTVSDHLWSTLEPLVYASQQGSPIARRSVATTIRRLRRRATAGTEPQAALDELLELMEDDHEPRPSGAGSTAC